MFRRGFFSCKTCASNASRFTKTEQKSHVLRFPTKGRLKDYSKKVNDRTVRLLDKKSSNRTVCVVMDFKDNSRDSPSIWESPRESGHRTERLSDYSTVYGDRYAHYIVWECVRIDGNHRERISIEKKPKFCGPRPF